VNDSIAWHRHSERLAERLAAQGVPHLNLLLPWATHAFDFNLRGPGGQLTRYALAWYLARVTEPKGTKTQDLDTELRGSRQENNEA